MQEQLKRLKKMQGFDSNNKVKCSRIRFETSYGPHAEASNVIDPLLNVLLVDTAIEHLEIRLQEIDSILVQAEKALG